MPCLTPQQSFNDSFKDKVTKLQSITTVKIYLQWLFRVYLYCVFEQAILPKKFFPDNTHTCLLSTHYTRIQESKNNYITSIAVSTIRTY